ncbi:hypothetical protein [Parvimonas micra]|uniref:hypothetical protein n=1 Tax=Parvimonas micra TaxID=33033 RepID=UPI00123859BC|nr:hypothetical protein [Parvimonas micra]
MKKFLIVCTLILSMGLGFNIVTASEHFEPTHSNTKSGKEYGIKEEYRVRKLENGKLEIEFKKGFFTIVDKDEISTICDLDCDEYTDIPDDTDEVYNERNNSAITRFKTLKVYDTSPNFPYSRYYEEYSDYFEAWYAGTLTLDKIICVNSTRYIAIYSGIIYLQFK